jgi:Asp/Glu/hydantoin racemase
MRIMFLGQAPRNPNGGPASERTLNLLRSYCSPGTEIDTASPDDYEGARVRESMSAQSVLTGLSHAMATGALIRKTVWAERQGYDAVIQSNTFDPAIEASRCAVRIPVIGVMRCTLHAAATLSDRIGITVPLPGHVPYTRRILRSYGLEHFVTDVRAVGVYGAAIEKQELFAAAVETMRGIMRDTNPECFVPLGGALIPYIVDPLDLQRELGLPVFNTKSTSIRFAETCHALGLSHSEITYPTAKLDYEDFVARAFEA